MFTLSSLPFEKSALEPHISAKTLEFHHGKHHQAYVDNLNKLIAGTELETASLEDIISKTLGSANQATIFNNAAQAYNHDFFWKSLRPLAEPMEPNSELLSLINESFGSLKISIMNSKQRLSANSVAAGFGWCATA